MSSQFPPPVLNAREWSAVANALREADACGCAPHFFRKRDAEIAPDPRREAVRRFVCTTRRRRAPARDLADGLTSHGFNPAQIDAIALLSL
ncbi:MULTISPECIES: hypothetical protein [Sphingomonas]|uniref:Uncharacterized protein n=1 Tax=Sphingomonas echinoides TaxID=59803 RepID=A0ABU4PJB8_9SPHN|nr:hypothetical protein [Sphingomonas echinoides]MDX5984276.1 hypothetical protein [Sphingomonas echinoides]